MARNIIDQLIVNGEVERGWLGVMIQDLDQELSDYYGIKENNGALVSEVIEGDPAAKAGIQPRDLITEIDGNKIEDARDLIRKISEISVGKKVTISVIRNGKSETLHVTIGKRNDMDMASNDSSLESLHKFGLRVTEMSPEMANRLNLQEPDGILVAEVEPESIAAEKGFQMGDIIKEINNQPIKTIQELKNYMNKSGPGNAFKILIYRVNAGLRVIEIG
jgi:serine protease Do